MSIRYLSIKNSNCTLGQLSRLFKQTPRLRRLSATVTSNLYDNRLIDSASSLISLEISFAGCVDSMKRLFQQLPNLCYLTLETSSVYLDDRNWEEILTKYLFYLKMFRLKMGISFSDSDNLENQVDQLLDTFRTDFWIEQHKWFVRYDCESYIGKYNRGILYTVPYAFSRFVYSNPKWSKSTCHNDTDYRSYDQVQILRCTDGGYNLFDDSIISSFSFSHLHQLQIDSFLHEKLLLIFPSLCYLYSLDITICDDSPYSQFQTLLDRAPNLYSLKLYTFPGSRRQLYQAKYTSIRRLDLIQYSVFDDHPLDTEECSLLINSPLGQQCEVLLTGVKDLSNVFDLLLGMTKLRMLSFSCQDDSWSKVPLSERKNELVQWLDNHGFINRYLSMTLNKTFIYQLWIR